MLRALVLTMIVLLLPVAAESAEAGSDPCANAALKYWQAFATMPKFTDAEQTKLIAEQLTMPLDAHAKELVTKAEYALRMMHQGAALRNCEWEIGWEADGVEVLLPQMYAARVLCSLASVRARMRFEEDRNAEAINDVVVALTLGRHVSLDGSLIGVLVGYNIEARTSEALALNLPKLSAGMIPELKKRLAALPQGGRPAAGLRKCEEKSLDWFIRKVKEAKDKEGLTTFLSWIGISEGKDRDRGDRVRAFLEECGGTAAGVIKFAEEVRPCYALMAQELDLPLEQFEKAFERETIQRAGNPVFKVFFPALPKCRRAQARAEMRRALLSAALDVQLDGRDALKNHPVPVVGGSFEYASFPGGFELRSKLTTDDGKPVALTVGHHEN